MNKNIKRITPVEFIILLIMSGCFFAALYFVWQGDRTYSLVFFVLQALLFIVYIFISNDRMTKVILDMNEKNTQFLGIEHEIKTGNIEKLKKENDRLTKQTEQFKKDMAGLRDENKSLSLQLVEKEQAVSYTEKLERYNVLLPENEVTADNDIIRIINNVYEKFSGRCQEKGIRLNLSTICGQLSMVCDERFVEIMLSNIVDNSIKYMNKNGSLVTTVSDIGEEGIFIVCKDNGKGLPAAEVPYIFGLNFQGSNRKSGNGLGLAQVKAIAEHYGGNVYAKSDLDEGMAIYIQFPSCNRR